MNHTLFDILWPNIHKIIFNHFILRQSESENISDNI